MLDRVDLAVAIGNNPVEEGRGLSYLKSGRALFLLRPEVLEDNVYRGFSQIWGYFHRLMNGQR